MPTKKNLESQLSSLKNIQEMFVGGFKVVVEQVKNFENKVANARLTKAIQEELNGISTSLFVSLKKDDYCQRFILMLSIGGCQERSYKLENGNYAYFSDYYTTKSFEIEVDEKNKISKSAIEEFEKAVKNIINRQKSEIEELEEAVKNYDKYLAMNNEIKRAVAEYEKNVNKHFRISWNYREN